MFIFLKYTFKLLVLLTCGKRWKIASPVRQAAPRAMSTVIASLQYLPRAGHITADESTDKKKMTVSAPHPWRITEGDNIKVITNHTVRQ